MAFCPEPESSGARPISAAEGAIVSSTRRVQASNARRFHGVSMGRVTMSPNCHLIVTSASGCSEMCQKEETIIRNPENLSYVHFRDRAGRQSMGTILVIEDDERILKALQRLFSSEGYEIRSAGNGKQGLEMFASPGLDAVVLDLMLPEMSGRDVCRSMKQSLPGYACRNPERHFGCCGQSPAPRIGR